MNNIMKTSLKFLLGMALTMQLAGCFYVGDDHRWHGGHREYHEPSVDVRLHN